MHAARFILLAGTLVATIGLAGFWLWPQPDTTQLSTVHESLLGVGADDFHISALIAGRDITYHYSSSEPVYSQSGQIICWRPNGSRSIMGSNTDTIIYASLRNDDLTLISIPRDLFVETDGGTAKINTLIQQGPEVLKRAVSNVLGVPIDHYVILNLEIFRNLVDALGGVEVDVPYRMRYHDCTGGLDIDLQPGLQVLDGKQASDFARFRDLPRADLDRLENLKQLALAAVRRLQELNVSAVTRIPALLDTFLTDVDTSVVPADVTALLPKIGSFRIGTMATLPTREVFRDGKSGLTTDAAETEWFLASVFGGSAREFTGAPEETLIVTDRSGVEGALDWYLHLLTSVGVPEENVIIREAEFDANPTRLVATLEGWEAAGYYASLLNTGIQEVSRIGTVAGEARQLELVLGPDATGRINRQPAEPPVFAPEMRETAEIGSGTPN